MKRLKVTYKRNEYDAIFDCLVYAEWAGDCTGRKSTSGYVIIWFENVNIWKSRKQGSVTKLSTFAEYTALSEAISKLKFVEDLVESFYIYMDAPIKIYDHVSEL